jgi:hypothetical protein
LRIELYVTVTPIYLQFKNSMLPDVWLTSFITPIFKDGNPSDTNIYHLIALTAKMCKKWNRFNEEQVVQFHVDKGHINKCKNGFIKHHSIPPLNCSNAFAIGQLVLTIVGRLMLIKLILPRRLIQLCRLNCKDIDSVCCDSTSIQLFADDDK